MAKTVDARLTELERALAPGEPALVMIFYQWDALDAEHGQWHERPYTDEWLAGAHICDGPDAGELTADEWRSYLAVHGAERAAYDGPKIIDMILGNMQPADI